MTITGFNSWLLHGHRMHEGISRHENANSSALVRDAQRPGTNNANRGTNGGPGYQPVATDER